jgi:hypothetical protein
MLYRQFRRRHSEGVIARLATNSIREAADAIISLINAKPTSPTQEEIEAAIRAAVSVPDQQVGNCTLRSDEPDRPLTFVEFGPALGPDGKPPDFGFTNQEFADLYCPYIRIAFVMLGRDRAGVEEFVRGLTEDSPDALLVFRMLRAWDDIDGKFKAIAGIAQSAWARVIAVSEVLCNEDSHAGHALNRGAELYLDGLDDKHRRASGAPAPDRLERADAYIVRDALSGPADTRGRGSKI